MAQLRQRQEIGPTAYTDEELKWCLAMLNYLVSLLGNEERAKRKIPPSTPRNRSAPADDDDAVAASVASPARTTSVTGSWRSDSAGQGARARDGDLCGDVRGGARAARVQEDSKTDNDLMLAPKGSMRCRSKSVSLYPHFANLHDSIF
jgi:hypothetical protein